jgi:2-dehydro-3-deoxyphosphogluconate aldolase/(4S)-4-hydroxy-2-oxoglutarate aldolase
MTREEVLKIFEACRLIAIVRSDPGGRELELVSLLHEAGIRMLEVSMVAPNFDSTLSNLTNKFGSAMALGAGTVLSTRDLKRAHDAGAAFIVSPDGNPHVVEETQKAGLASFPGGMTPTEILRLRAWGADAIKLFPAVSLGPKFVLAMRGPLPDIRLIPTGGVRLEDLPAYWQAGAAAVAIGSELISTASIDPGRREWLRTTAQAFVRAARRNSDAA